MNFLSIQNISKQYTVKDPPAVNSVSFDCEQGEIVALIGCSGSGKTTMLRIVAGLEIPDTGEIVLDGETLNSASVYVTPEKRNCGLVFQDYALFPNKTVRQNINFGKGATNDLGLIEQLIEMAGIGGLEHRFPHEISGGQQQRVALVRALATRPMVLLLDEPLSHLDPELKESVRAALVKLLRTTQTTALYVSHDIPDTMAMSDRMVVLRDGQTEQIGTPSEVYNQPATSYVSQLFGKTNFIPYELIPESTHTVVDEHSECQVVPTRPHQWRIIDNATADCPTFKGKVRSVDNRGSYREVVIETERFKVSLHIAGKQSVQVGDSLTVSCNVTE